jgi:hypothetical protein
MHHPHDHGYKDLFSHPELLRELLLSCVPEPWVRDMDFSRACKIDKSFITASQKRLPSVFPILLYNGDDRWTAPENLADLIDQRISLDFIPRFRYFKIAENEFSREKLLSLKNLIGALFLVETTDQEALVPLVTQIVDILRQEQPEVVKAFVSWLHSFFADPVPDWVADVSQLTEVPTMLATTVKKWKEELLQQGLQEGLQQGRNEGRTEGRYEGIRMTARNLKKKGMPLAEIAEVTGLSIEEIEKL